MNVIYCAGEQGRVVADILRRWGSDEEIVFVDDDPELWEATVDGHEVLGGEYVLQSLDSQRDQCIVAIGGNSGTRTALAERVHTAGIPLFSAIDVDTTISDTATIGGGTIVNAQTYIGPGAIIEDCVLIDSVVNVSHDAHLHRGVTVAPGVALAGGVDVGTEAYLGAGAIVLDHISIGEGAVVGAGAVVLEDVPPETTVVGIPARPRDRAEDRGEQ